MLLDGLFLDYAGRAANRRKKRKISISVLGTAAGLLDDMSIGEFFCPTGVVDQVDIRERRKIPDIIVHKIHNILVGDGQREMIIYNVSSVIDETSEELLFARDTPKLSCCGVEMEVGKFASAIGRARRAYADYLEVRERYGVVVSDKPLHDITLADEPPIRNAMVAGARRILDHIGSRE
jgi:hypothetical protein